jgi:hypothetical protein
MSPIRRTAPHSSRLTEVFQMYVSQVSSIVTATAVRNLHNEIYDE